MGDANTAARSVKPVKPWPTFPLSAHDNGQWYCTRRIAGRKVFFYFGEWADDPKGDRAYAAWLASASDLKAGRRPTATTTTTPPPFITAAEVVERYLASEQLRVEAGEIGARQFDDIRRTCLYYFLDAVGEAAPVEGLDKIDALKTRPLDRLRAELDKRVGIYRFNNSMRKIRRMLRWAYRTAKLITVALHEDEALRQKRKKLVRRSRRLRHEEHGKPIFAADECRLLITESAKSADTSPLFAFILLGLNAGMGQSHISDLPRSPSVVDLDGGFVDWVRVKTEEICQFPLWPITSIAIAHWLRRRPAAKNKADDERLFLTKYGHPWVQEYVKLDADGGIGDVNPDDAIAKEFDKLQKRLGIKQRGRGFYALRRTFSTVAQDLADKDAVKRVMGHGLEGMDPHYVLEVPRWRLENVTAYVGHRLLGCVAASGISPAGRAGGGSLLFPSPAGRPGRAAG